MIGAATEFVSPSIDWFAITPLLILLGGGLLLLVGASLTPVWPKRTYAFTTVAIAIGALVMTFIQWDNLTDSAPRFLIGRSLSWDAFSMFGTIIILVSVALTSLIADDYLRREGWTAPRSTA